jgi:hypothetical protein
MLIPHSIGSFQGRRDSTTDGHILNMFVEPNSGSPDQVPPIFGRPGLKEWTDTGSGGCVRALFTSSETSPRMYAVTDNKIYRYQKDKTKTEIGELVTECGHVSIADNGKEIIFVDGDGYTFTINSEKFEKITDSDFPGGYLIYYLDGYFIISTPNTGQFNVCRLYKGREWDALDFASEEGAPDNIVSHIVDHREVLLFGGQTTGVWYNAGGSDFPLRRIQGSFMEKGCAAAYTPAKINNTVYWLSNELQVVAARGYSPQPVSTLQMDYQISNYDKIDDAYAFTYVFEGHPFYHLTFPSEGVTWVLDTGTLLWHKESSWSDFNPGQQWHHRASCHAFFDNKHLVGDYRNGLIYEMKSNHYADHKQPIKKQFTLAPIEYQNNRIEHSELSFNLKYGTGTFGRYMTDSQGNYMLSSKGEFIPTTGESFGDSVSPKAYIDLEYSDDGHTWVGKRKICIGTAGSYDYIAKAVKLGTARNRTYRITCAEPIKFVMLNAMLQGR